MRLLLAALFLTSRWLAADDAQPVPAQFTGKSIFLSAILKASVGALPQRHISGITVPHHLLARDRLQTRLPWHLAVPADELSLSARTITILATPIFPLQP